MSKKKKTLVVTFVVMGIVILGLAAAVYAKYIASLTANGDVAKVAKWAFASDNQNAELSCPLTQYDPATLVGDRIAPGTSGTCTFELSNENSEVGVDYTLTVSSITGAPKNIVLSYVNDQNETVTLTANSGSITGTMKPGDTGETLTINWEWPYYTNATDDEEDTEDGEAGGASSTAMAINFSISGIQVQPQ